MSIKQIKPLFILFAVIFILYGCEKENDDFSTNLDTTYFVETFLSLTYDQDIDQLVDDAFFDSSIRLLEKKKFFVAILNYT